METLPEKNRNLIKAYFEEIWNKGNLHLLPVLVDETYINHSSSIPGTPPGPEGLKPIVESMRRAFPDLHYELLDVVTTSDRAVARVRMSGTHLGDFFGIAATGRSVSVQQINIEHIIDGKIREHWRLTDELGLMKQLGLISV